MAKIIRAPSHLSKEAKKTWKELIFEYAIEDEAGLRILQAALEAFDRAQLARVSIGKHGMVYTDKAGQPKPHPLLTVERDSRAAFLSGLKSLNLDIEPLRDKPGRPGGR